MWKTARLDAVKRRARHKASSTTLGGDRLAASQGGQGSQTPFEEGEGKVRRHNKASLVNSMLGADGTRASHTLATAPGSVGFFELAVTEQRGIDSFPPMSIYSNNDHES